jgi:segregation and condensation protein B
MDDNKIGILEGLLFVVGDDGLTLNQIMEILEVDKDMAYSLINELEKKYENVNSGLHIHILGDAFKLTTKKEHREYYEKLLFNEENNSLSNSALETLAIIAYNEPITRVQVDEIRGVQTAQLIRKLVAKGLIKEDGRSSLPGRPILYRTTNEFLDYFGLSNISELPKINIDNNDNDDSEVDLYESSYKDEVI